MTLTVPSRIGYNPSAAPITTHGSVTPHYPPVVKSSAIPPRPSAHHANTTSHHGWRPRNSYPSSRTPNYQNGKFTAQIRHEPEPKLSSFIPRTVKILYTAFEKVRLEIFALLWKNSSVIWLTHVTKKCPFCAKSVHIVIRCIETHIILTFKLSFCDRYTQYWKHIEISYGIYTTSTKFIWILIIASIITENVF